MSINTISGGRKYVSENFLRIVLHDDCKLLTIMIKVQQGKKSEIVDRIPKKTSADAYIFSGSQCDAGEQGIIHHGKK